MSKDTTVIAYGPGLYGTYLAWCLTTLTTSTSIQEPFTAIGNSHKFRGVILKTIEDWDHYINSEIQHPFVRLHPKTRKDQKLDNLLTCLNKTAKSVIHLYPERDAVVFYINNYTTKTHPSWWLHQLEDKHINSDLLYSNWPIDNSTAINQIPRWIQREFLSFYLMPAWFDQLEWYHPDRWQHPKVLVVTPKKLFFDFESTLLDIQQHCNLEFVRPISDLAPYNEKNLALQVNIGQDELCANILDAVQTKTYFEWESLPLASEVWIQWQLRNLGFEIQCHGLDKFPTNSVYLTELLYSV